MLCSASSASPPRVITGLPRAVHRLLTGTCLLAGKSWCAMWTLTAVGVGALVVLCVLRRHDPASASGAALPRPRGSVGPSREVGVRFLRRTPSLRAQTPRRDRVCDLTPGSREESPPRLRGTGRAPATADSLASVSSWPQGTARRRTDDQMATQPYAPIGPNRGSSPYSSKARKRLKIGWAGPWKSAEPVVRRSRSAQCAAMSPAWSASWVG